MNANPPQGGMSRLLARLARRDRWPRRWWWPPQDRPVSTPDTAKDYAERHREISETIRFSMLGLIGFSFFCALTLAAPDSVLLTGAGKIPVPFANTEIDFGTFITIGPLLLIGYTLYVHIFIGQLLKLPDVPEVDRAVTLFNLRGRVPSFLSYLVFYWLAPATVVFFAQRAAPREAGTWLFFVAAAFLLVLLVLQLRRNPYPRRWARPMLWLLVLAVALVPARVAWWVAQGGPRPFQRSWDLAQADLSKANLISAELDGANLKRANLQGADLTRASLRGADFSNADLGNASLQLADLREADLRGAKLDHADLRFANLRYAKAGEADLRTALVAPEQLKGLCFDSSTLFAAGAQPAQVPAHCGELARSNEFRACRLPREPVQCDRSVVTGVLDPPDGYVVECLQACDPYYVDRGRSHTLAEIPPGLEGGTWIKTTNTGDKNESAGDFLRFAIDPPAFVYVAYDSRVVKRGSPPAWLTEGFERTGMVVQLNEPDPNQDFDVYRRLYTRSPVVLGGNEAAGADFGGVGGSNYLVIVKRAGAPATPASGKPAEAARPR
ncbi:MAG TPA: pentapeptide repeat-containing protein [Luteimonas sp.]|nr:pentapeptide repeat-containing protein [Luteimonas sp.]